MAKKKRNTPIAQSTNTFDKGLNTDVRDYHLSHRAWTHARNAINNSHIGDLGDVGNEPANKFCTSAPYTIIGSIHLEKELWCIFSTNDTDSEIGTFDAKTCEYTTIVNDPCLAFKRTHLISGASRPTFDCSWQVYWQDNLNPDRTLDLGDVPWVQECTDSECIECHDTDELDCDKLRLEQYIEQPCTRLEKGPAGGNILNGSYYAQIAYQVNGQRVTDYFPQSNVLHLFAHGNINASIDVYLENLDTNFDEYELVLVQFIAEKFSARQIGVYSTNQTRVTIDNVDETLPAIKAEDLILTNPIADKSEGIFSVGKYLFRTGITGKFDFNYQPLANQITAKWQVVEYPKYYYRDGGSNVGHMRDEVYPYFIRFVYETGDKSNSYHIPGRGPRPYLTPDGSGLMNEDDDYLNINDNNIEQQQGTTSKVFEMFNTATATPVSVTLPDGGEITAEGDMGYWESTELYPDDNPEVWNANVQGRPDLDLCGKPIRHHKFPENSIYDGNGSSDITNHYVDGGEKIRILAIAFDNIQPPVDNQGNLIPGIVGYEILRGSRDGNKTVLYKGMINNMRQHDLPASVSSRDGLYPNYPFNSLDPDPFTSTTETSYQTIGGLTDYNPNPNYRKDHFTFHSPDTMFYKPFLQGKELKIYGSLYGDAECEYIEPNKHPKHVMITDVAFFVGLMVGIGTALLRGEGKKSYTRKMPSYYQYPVFTGTGSTNQVPPGLNSPIGYGVWAGLVGANTTLQQLSEETLELISQATGFDAAQIQQSIQDAANVTAVSATVGSGITSYGVEFTVEDGQKVPPLLKAVYGWPLFVSNVSEGADLTYDIIRNVSKPQQFARQFLGYCGYENFAPAATTNKRRLINDAQELESHIQNYGTQFKINNILRPRTITFDTAVDVEDITGTIADSTFDTVLLSEIAEPTFIKRASSHYAAFKTRLRNQYGQINNIRQIPITPCVIDLSNTSSGTLFGGDTYIGRYQEKNTFYHFYQWLYDQPDFAEFNYHNYDTVQHTAFWMDTDPFDTHQFIASIQTALTNFINSPNPANAVATFFSSLVTPSDLHCFDRQGANQGLLTIKDAYMYLFHSSIRDFFVESEINIDLRDHDEEVATRHWDALQDLKQMFDTQFIRAGNYYKIDRSLFVSKMPYMKLNWGSVQDINYNPTKAETCYTDYPLRLLYSLPQQTKLKADNWRAFLANNYKDFTSKVTAIKAIRQTGIILLFENEAPGSFPGVDELQLRSGTSITVGDGGLFSREMQRLDNSDREFEFGACQSRRGVINTPAGLYYLNQYQGKGYMMSGGLKEITLKNNQYWFNQYLPYKLLDYFPDYDILDNPVFGIGCQATYDNEWGIVYFAKRDFVPKAEYVDVMEYIGDGLFRIDGIVTAETGDPQYFDNASWTVSYDPKNQEELSYHDWHPGLMMGGPNSFFTTRGSSIWEHNVRCDLYCNFYNVDYPFEIELQIDNLPAVTTVRSIEYFMQVFEFANNCRDRYHNLDFNFDEAIVYNSEQVSGLLKLNLAPYNDVALLAQYPIVGANQIDILYSKEEHKYRFNQFWDIVRDRGEFTLTNDTIWNTEANGYIRNLNPANIDYNKAEFQRKRFRHNNNRVLLRRTVCGNKKMILFLTNTKIQNSPR